jgi:hypothetical protein
MPLAYACDHCGRTGVTFGVYYPGRDMTKPPVRLCQTYNGVPIQPNCYHLVVERGEPLGLRKDVQIRAEDRHAPKVEAVAIRNADNRSVGLVLNETDTPADEPVLLADTSHPLTGESIPLVPPDHELSPAITEAEKGKGIIDPYGATQKPLVDPDSPEAQEYLDRLAEEEAAKISVPGGLAPTVGLQGTQPGQYIRGGDNGPHVNPGDTASVPPWEDPYGDEPIATQQPHVAQDVITNAPFEPAATKKTPAQVAAEAQQRANEENAEKRAAAAKATPAKKAPAKKAAAKKTAPQKPKTDPSQTPNPANPEVTDTPAVKEEESNG